MQYDYDLIIVGAGPAGATMAIVAAHGGLKVLLLDRKKSPRDKVCGDALLPAAMSILENLGLATELLREPHRMMWSMRLFGEAFHRRLTLQQPVVVSRRVILDNILYRAAQRDVDTEQGWSVHDLLWANGRVTGVVGTTDEGRSFSRTSRVVAGADGCTSIVARQTGCYRREPRYRAVATRAYYRGVTLDEDALEMHFRESAFPGYFWIFPVDEACYNVGVVMRAETLVGGSTSLRQEHEALVRSRRMGGRFACAELLSPIDTWSLPLAHRSRAIHGNGFILAGDAAGLVDPFWGDGVDTAMISGMLAGRRLVSVCRDVDYGAQRLQPYADGVWKVLARKFRASELLAECRSVADIQVGLNELRL